MKTKYLNILIVALAGAMLGGCGDYPPLEIYGEIFVNKTSLNLYVGDEVQVRASPGEAKFTWSSINEAVATVSQTGLIKGVSDGISTIIVASDVGSATIEVVVKTFVPLTDIGVPDTVFVTMGSTYQIRAVPVPADASEYSFTYRSENPDIVTVDENGVLIPRRNDTATIIVSSGSIEKAVTVIVPYVLTKCDPVALGWTVEVSDAHSEGGGKNTIIDGNTGGGYWHSMYSPDAPLPHWVIIDMRGPVKVGKLVTYRRSNGDTKTLQYFIGDDPNPESNTWVKIAERTYASTSANHTMTLDIEEPRSGRYLKLVTPDTYRGTFIAIHEIEVWGWQ